MAEGPGGEHVFPAAPRPFPDGVRAAAQAAYPFGGISEASWEKSSQ